MRSAAVLIAQRGLAATGMRDVADHAEAPRGSLHHYFPHGKDQLTDEALAAIGGAVRALLDDARTCPDSGGPAGTRVLDRFVGLWREGLRSTDMTLGCSVSAVVHDSVEPALRRAAQVFDLWREPIAQELTATSVDPERAGALATTVVAALEGAVILSRARRDPAPLDETAAVLRTLLTAAVAEAGCAGPP